MRNYEFDRIKRIVDEAESVVFFGGAGVNGEWDPRFSRKQRTLYEYRWGSER